MADPTRTPEPFPAEVRAEFRHRADVVFLNHGSFGSVPRCVQAAQDAWRERLEADPIELIGRRITELLAEVKRDLAGFVGGDPASIGFVTNATEGVNAALRSLPLQPGDELLCTDHVYNAVLQAMRHRAAETGAKVVVVPVTVPATGQAGMLAEILAGVTPRTRVAVIDHVTSVTGLRFPLEAVAKALPPTVTLLADGAHAPGSLPLDLAAIGAPFYTANLHKWVMAPRGSAFLRVDASQASRTHPCIISHRFGDGFEPEFDWQGTRDFSAWLAVPAALGFLRQLGWQRVLRHNHDLATWAHRLLVEGLGVEPVSPLDGSCLTCMATVQVPDPLRRFGSVEALQADLRSVDGIEVPGMAWSDRWWFRVSAAVHNLPEHYERLLQAMQRRLRG
jgi:isopenicillin-N epimerase